MAAFIDSRAAIVYRRYTMERLVCRVLQNSLLSSGTAGK
jgi:hypothetical protein